MGSNPPNSDLPFGYSFDPMPNISFPSTPPEHPAGPALLDDNESKFLDSFFDGVNSDQFNYDLLANPQDGTDFGLGWNDLPPEFVGTTSSSGQQAQALPQVASQGLSSMISGNMSTSVNSLPPVTTSSPDVLAAATLLQNGSNGSRGMGDEMFGNRSNQISPTNTMFGTQPKPPYTPATTSLQQPSAYSSNIFGMNYTTTNTKPFSRSDLRWGSDIGFGTPQSFVLPTNQMEAEASERSKIQTMDAFFEVHNLPSTAGNTQPSSPNVPQPFMSSSRHGSSEQPNEEDDDRPRKRRKSKYQDHIGEEDDDEYAEPAVNTQQKPNGVKKRRSTINKSTAKPTSAPESSSHRRRKSSTNAAAKAARENLTEDQKRENHIKSEQKRRTLIREGFEDLGELVPGLKGGGFSKSAVLTMAADWLEELIRGNEVLRERIEELKNGA